jgi:hypothetical protein
VNVSDYTPVRAEASVGFGSPSESAARLPSPAQSAARLPVSPVRSPAQAPTPSRRHHRDPFARSRRDVDREEKE